MKTVKTSAIALTISALMAGPVLAQGAASDTQTRGSMQQGGAIQGGAAAGAGTEMKAPATKGTVGSATGGTVRGTAGATGNAAPGAAPNGLEASGSAAAPKRH
jgi:hypothetical protein